MKKNNHGSMFVFLRNISTGEKMKEQMEIYSKYCYFMPKLVVITLTSDFTYITKKPFFAEIW
jgi:hypothetical protein